jgi:hypothetical protein
MNSHDVSLATAAFTAGLLFAYMVRILFPLNPEKKRNEWFIAGCLFVVFLSNLYVLVFGH